MDQSLSESGWKRNGRRMCIGRMSDYRDSLILA